MSSSNNDEDDDGHDGDSISIITRHLDYCNYIFFTITDFVCLLGYVSMQFLLCMIVQTRPGVSAAYSFPIILCLDD